MNRDESSAVATCSVSAPMLTLAPEEVEDEDGGAGRRSSRLLEGEWGCSGGEQRTLAVWRARVVRDASAPYRRTLPRHAICADPRCALSACCPCCLPAQRCEGAQKLVVLGKPRRHPRGEPMRDPCHHSLLQAPMPRTKTCRYDSSLGLLTKKFVALIQAAQEGAGPQQGDDAWRADSASRHHKCPRGHRPHREALKNNIQWKGMAPTAPTWPQSSKLKGCAPLAELDSLRHDIP